MLGKKVEIEPKSVLKMNKQPNLGSTPFRLSGIIYINIFHIKNKKNLTIVNIDLYQKKSSQKRIF